ncbi:MAG TPA: hypothetical protein VMX54_02025 [Vicinamibacteria bacterium]|nr:hypothetical protein [Vicinamibacteria bacterium]
MRSEAMLTWVTAGLLSAGVLAAPAAARADGPQKEKVQVKIPEPGVPQIMTMEGRYVRAAYNNEGYVILGYRLVNQSVGEPWMLLEVGFALRDGRPDYTMPRDAISLDTPAGQTVPLPTVEEFRKTDVRALMAREKVQRDSINYFPPNAYQACRIGFFNEVDSRAQAWDTVELNNQRACLGRLFFEVPGGISYGQYWLNVKFKETLIRVPFRVLTKEEDKMLEKNYRDIEKQVKDAFAPKKKS